MLLVKSDRFIVSLFHSHRVTSPAPAPTSSHTTAPSSPIVFEDAGGGGAPSAASASRDADRFEATDASVVEDAEADRHEVADASFVDVASTSTSMALATDESPLTLRQLVAEALLRFQDVCGDKALRLRPRLAEIAEHASAGGPREAVTAEFAHFQPVLAHLLARLQV